MIKEYGTSTIPTNIKEINQIMEVFRVVFKTIFFSFR
ncbi:hypothetical protein LCGC14_0638440 [marine sediment metagenome]|uniref:Uncharacterized protein n=1 Tax=marine sediment metagenome TaxID=412755 RepID=A0A0F9R586_9ZZZZ